MLAKKDKAVDDRCEKLSSGNSGGTRHAPERPASNEAAETGTLASHQTETAAPAPAPPGFQTMSANYCSGSSKNCPAPAHDQAVLHNLCARETPGSLSAPLPRAPLWRNAARLNG